VGHAAHECVGVEFGGGFAWKSLAGFSSRLRLASPERHNAGNPASQFRDSLVG
jgi:hypothetical protein